MGQGLSRIELEAISEQQKRAARLHVAEHYVQPFIWTWWLTLTWAHQHSEARAAADLKAWATQMQRRGYAGVFGIHNDTDALHAHGVLHAPGSRLMRPGDKCLLGVARTFYQEHWKRHGRVTDLRRYDVA